MVTLTVCFIVVAPAFEKIRSEESLVATIGFISNVTFFWMFVFNM
ncbi:unnamed protein product [Acanthoscelides obtectus]|uniref:Uncharacterized protein n=1 Tax=Acanthoscelides obtectus TaxID=200917 RepID=A0A9P0MMT2_ACAOB|nr:unnamed protein product [Acanthoscelides obtectus]CAK1631792.1 hypothetical protein AOBTE_LOCUS7164 [Acanthoscelides obtectus]